MIAGHDLDARARGPAGPAAARGNAAIPYLGKGSEAERAGLASSTAKAPWSRTGSTGDWYMIVTWHLGGIPPP